MECVHARRRPISLDLARFRSGHHPALRRWQHLVGVSEDAISRLCGEAVKSAEHIWLRYQALLLGRHLSDLGHAMDEPVRHPGAAPSLLRIILMDRGNSIIKCPACKKSSLIISAIFSADLNNNKQPSGECFHQIFVSQLSQLKQCG